MGIEEVTAVSSEALYLVIKVAAPVLLVSLVVGLIISIFQTVTSHSGTDTDLCSKNYSSIFYTDCTWSLDTE